MIEVALYSILSNDAAVIAIVGDDIYPGFAPQGTDLPYIAYSRESTNHVEVLSGSHGLARATMSVESFSSTYIEARDISEKVRLALQGQVAKGTHAGVVVDSVNVTGERAVGIAPQNADQPGTFSFQLDFGMWFTEAVPA